MECVTVGHIGMTFLVLAGMFTIGAAGWLFGYFKRGDDETKWRQEAE